MSTITIIIPDSKVYIDGVARTVQLPAYPENWLVVQWYDSEKRGYIDVKIGDRIPLRDRKMIDDAVTLWAKAAPKGAPKPLGKKAGTGKPARGVKEM